MEQALLESMNSNGLSEPNPKVGCVLVKEGKEIARGFTRAFGSFHAERVAFGKLDPNEDLSQVTAYVTLEPCSHFGSQPPCVDLFLKTKTWIKRVVIALLDPDDRVNGSGIQKLKDAGIEVKVGVLEKEASLWNFPFLLNRKKKVPVWIGKWAQTTDGFVADANGESKWITNPKSRAYTHWLRQKYDVIIVGAQTYLKDQPKLTIRDCAPPYNRNPVPYVFDPKGILLDHSKPIFMKTFVCQSVIDAKKGDPKPWVVSIEGEPSSPALFGNFQKAVESELLPTQRPLQSIFVEGGARLLNGMLAEDRFDALHIFTGNRTFEKTSDRYRIQFTPSNSWVCASRHNFEQDLLQEWVKGF